MSSRKLLKSLPSPSSLKPKPPNPNPQIPPNPNPTLIRRLVHHPSFTLSSLHHLLSSFPNLHHSTSILLSHSLSSSPLHLPLLLPFLHHLHSHPCPCSSSSIFSCPFLPLIHSPPISSLLRSQNLPNALTAFRLLASSLDSKPPTSLYNLFLSSFSKSHNHHLTLNWYHQMTHIDRVAPDVTTFNSLIASAFRCGQFHSGLAHFREMQGKGLQPNVVTFNTLIKGFFREKRFTEGIAIAREMVEMSVATVEILMSGLCKEGRVGEMRDLLVEFLSKGAMPDGVEVLGLVEALCGEGKVEEAVGLVGCFWEVGKRVHVVSCTPVIEGLRRMGKVEEAIRFVERMVVEEEEGVVDRITFNGLLGDVCRVGRTGEGERLRMVVEGKGFVADEETMRILVKGFGREGKLREGERIVDEMLDRDMIQNIATYNQLMEGLQSGKKSSSHRYR